MTGKRTVFWWIRRNTCLTKMLHRNPSLKTLKPLKPLKVLITLDARRTPKSFQHLSQLRKSSLMCWTSLRRSGPPTHYYSLLVQYNTEMSDSLFLQWHTEMSRDVTPLVLVQKVLKYRQHATHTNPIVFEDNPLSWWKAHGHHFPTLSRLACRFLAISVKVSLRFERLGLIELLILSEISTVGSTSHWETHSFQSVTPSFRSPTDKYH